MVQVRNDLYGLYGCHSAYVKMCLRPKSVPSLSAGSLDSGTLQQSPASRLTSVAASFPAGAKITIIFCLLDLGTVLRLTDSYRYSLSMLKSVTLLVTVRGASHQLRVQLFVLCFKENAAEL